MAEKDDQTPDVEEIPPSPPTLPQQLPSRTWRRFLKRLECPVDENADYINDRWTNRDLIPIPKERRTWGVSAFSFYWVVNGICLSGWTIGSTLLAYGLTPSQSIGCVVAAGILTGLTSVSCGWLGTRHHIGYTVSSRFTYGMNGSYIAVIFRSFAAVCWFGVQAFLGGACTAVCIGAIWPSFWTWESSIPASANVTGQQIIGLFVWYVFFCAFSYIAPEKLVKPFIACAVAFFITCIGMVAWSTSTAGGAGALWSTPNSAPNESASLAFAIGVVTSAWATGMLGQSDMTRYARTKNAPMLSQLLFAPLFMTLGALFGIITTSAAADFLGDIYWEPYDLLYATQEYYHNSSKARAGVFFAAFGCAVSQMAINLLVNSISVGMDCAGLWPRFINIRRGQYACAILGVAICPWQLLATAATFLTFLNGFGVVLAPMMGILTVDYLIIRRGILKMEDLYTSRRDGIYWYTFGFNWRGWFSLFMGAWPCFPGLVMLIENPLAANNWVSVYNVSMIVAFFVSAVTMLLVCWAFPPPGLGQGVKEVDEHTKIFEANPPEYWASTGYP